VVVGHPPSAAQGEHLPLDATVSQLGLVDPGDAGDLGLVVEPADGDRTVLGGIG
jgi:hypothetical protein